MCHISLKFQHKNIRFKTLKIDAGMMRAVEQDKQKHRFKIEKSTLRYSVKFGVREKNDWVYENIIFSTVELTEKKTGTPRRLAQKY